MTSVNSNNKSTHVASNFAAICRDNFRRVCIFYFFSFSYLENMLKISFLKQVDRTYAHGFSRPKKFRDSLISQLSKDLFFESPNCILKTESFNSPKSVTSFTF